MIVLYLILVIAGVLCLFASAAGVLTNRVNLLSLGLALIFTVELIQLAQKV